MIYLSTILVHSNYLRKSMILFDSNSLISSEYLRKSYFIYLNEYLNFNYWRSFSNRINDFSLFLSHYIDFAWTEILNNLNSLLFEAISKIYTPFCELQIWLANLHFQTEFQINIINQLLFQTHTIKINYSIKYYSTSIWNCS